ncbi:hypothetical protein ACN38_g3935 [Penicillium nordicum]|uniref:DUF202 domain-containing protein n=1 Tax=Penicillium nordicum TaxID=229535 RepID=A0A0M9WHL0_9EURO|nr:hypothetical protein ACN38_g3935 [Penicillium nordicum]
MFDVRLEPIPGEPNKKQSLSLRPSLFLKTNSLSLRTSRNAVIYIFLQSLIMIAPHEAFVPEEPPNVILTDSRPTADTRDNDREALELRSIQTQEDNDLDYSTPSGSSGEEHRVSTYRTTSQADSRRREARKGLWGQLCRFWARHVNITVPQKSNRDHFALERTFLAYIRTSTMIAMQGVFVAQLFRLQRPSQTVDRLSFYEVGIPLSVACHFVAVIVALIGAFRFWRQQNAIVRGKVYAGGWELNSVGILSFGVILASLVLIVIISIQISLNPTALPYRILWS